MKILITGGKGFLAKNIYKMLTKKFDQVVSVSRDDFDLCDSEQTKNFFKNKYFDVVIHCAIMGGKRLVPDPVDIFHNNVRMSANILMNKISFGKVIYFGSGAELDRTTEINGNNSFYNVLPKDYYGFSKNIICRVFDNEKNFHNLRLYNVFSSDESEGRMITSNIKNYLLKKPILINKDRYMDFIFFDDFYKILEDFILGKIYYKELDCVYEKKYKLSEIAFMINNLDKHKVDIIFESEIFDNSYCGMFSYKHNSFLGLEKGLEQVFWELKNEKFTN